MSRAEYVRWLAARGSVIAPPRDPDAGLSDVKRRPLRFTKDQWGDVIERAESDGFRSRSEWLRALIWADK